jgi:hypothetical protein
LAGVARLETSCSLRSMAKSTQALPLKTDVAEAGRGWIEGHRENKFNYIDNFDHVNR